MSFVLGLEFTEKVVDVDDPQVIDSDFAYNLNIGNISSPGDSNVCLTVHKAMDVNNNGP